MLTSETQKELWLEKWRRFGYDFLLRVGRPSVSDVGDETARFYSTAKVDVSFGQIHPTEVQLYVWKLVIAEKFFRVGR